MYLLYILLTLTCATITTSKPTDNGFVLRNVQDVKPSNKYTSTCKPTVMEIPIKLDGCQEKTVKLFGCVGDCKSDTTLNVYTNKLYINCSCCKNDPNDEIVFYTNVYCPSRKQKVEPVKVLSAKSCSCKPCFNKSVI